MSKKYTDDKILVNETIDGVPAHAASTIYVDEVETETPQKKKDTEKVRHHRADPYIWGSYLLLLVVSIVELYSASSSEVEGTNVYGPLLGHLRYLIMGFALILLLQNIHYKIYRYLAPWAAVFCFILVLYSSTFGVVINGAQRAIAFAGITIQPAEMMKLALVMCLASILAKNQMQGGVTNKGVILCAAVTAVLCGSVYKNGFTNMALMACVAISMFIIGGMQSRKIFAILGLAVVVMAGGHMLNKSEENHKNAFTEVKATEKMSQAEYVEDNEADTQKIDRRETRRNRLENYLKGVHPGDPVTDDNYQVKHAHYAMAHGGVNFRGPGNSREAARLPLAFSDYIYSIIVEDMGIWGGLGLIVVYMILVARAGVMASKCRRAFPALLIMGCAVMIALQALVHMGIVTAVFPVSGQPLPLISKGGTSILVMSAAIGMMLSVSRFAVRNNNETAIRDELKELPEDLRSENPLLVK